MISQIFGIHSTKPQLSTTKRASRTLPRYGSQLLKLGIPSREESARREEKPKSPSRHPLIFAEPPQPQDALPSHSPEIPNLKPSPPKSPRLPRPRHPKSPSSRAPAASDRPAGWPPRQSRLRPRLPPQRRAKVKRRSHNSSCALAL
jgi:hypothetical protein